MQFQRKHTGKFRAFQHQDKEGRGEEQECQVFCSVMLYWPAVGKFEAKHGEDGTNSDVQQQFSRTGHKRRSSQDHNPEHMAKIIPGHGGESPKC